MDQQFQQQASQPVILNQELKSSTSKKKNILSTIFGILIFLTIMFLLFVYPVILSLTQCIKDAVEKAEIELGRYQRGEITREQAKESGLEFSQSIYNCPEKTSKEAKSPRFIADFIFNLGFRREGREF